MTITPNTDIALPSSFTFGKLVGRVISASGDTAQDADALPEGVAAQGSVTFTPTTTHRVAADAAGIQTYVAGAPVVCSFDANGHIVDGAGAQGVWLVVGTYKVSLKLTPVGTTVAPTVSDFTIEVTAAHTDAAPLQVFGILPPVGGTSVSVYTVSIPTGGAAGQILTRTQAGVAWADAPAGSAGTGTAGAKGDKGDPGLSAYQLAVAQGFQGTLSAWLTSLIGAKGDQGDQGIKGDQGIQGIQGIKGDQGIQGIKGDQGIQGIKGDTGAAGPDFVTVPTPGVPDVTLYREGDYWINDANGKFFRKQGGTWVNTGVNIRGPQGLPGADGQQGPKGDQGIQGVKGDTGIQGIQGIKGDKGDTGLQGTPGAAADTSTLVAKTTTLASAPTGPQVARNWNFTLATTSPNTEEHYINGFLARWSNEWGALRGSNPYTSFNDALVRAKIPASGPKYTGASGNYVELQDNRIPAGQGATLHGRRWSDGRLMRNDQLPTEVYRWKTGDADPTVAGTVALPAGATWIIQLATADTRPSWVPAGSIIIRS